MTAPSSPTLLPQGEKGANHHDHMLKTVQFTFIAPCSRHAADMVRFSCVRLRFANRTYGFKTGGLYPNRQSTVGCNKRSAVHREHMSERCNSLRSLHPTHAVFSKVTNPLGGFVTSDEHHSSTSISALQLNHPKYFYSFKNSHLKQFFQQKPIWPVSCQPAPTFSVRDTTR